MKFKKLTAVCLTAAMFLSAGAGAYAAENKGLTAPSRGAEARFAQSDGDFVIKDGVLVEYTGDGGNVVIPGNVTAIGESAFNGCVSLTGVTIPNSVKSIGNESFAGCEKLKTFTIPASVTNIGRNVFAVCYCLSTINVDPNNQYFSSKNGILYDKKKTTLIRHPINNGKSSLTIPSFVKVIGPDAFESCGRFTKITIPTSVTRICDSAFVDCDGLKSITIPNSVKSIGENAFSFCDELRSVRISASVTDISADAFDYCPELTAINVDSKNKKFSSKDGVLFDKKKTALLCFPNKKVKSVKIPATVKKIGEGAFADCEELTSVTLPNSVTSVGELAFARCFSLKSVTIPDSVTAIGDSAFAECEYLARVTFPLSVRTIGSCTFYDCDSLTTVTLLNPSVKIDLEAFTECDNLKDVYYAGSSQQWYYSGLSDSFDPAVRAHCDYRFALTAQPSGKTVILGSPVTLSVKAEADGLKYQWYFKKSGQSSFSKWSGRTRPSETVTPPEAWNGIQLYCLVKDSAGNSIRSATVKITVNKQLNITKQPANLRVKSGANGKFSVAVNCSDASYQWYYKKSGQSSWSKWKGKTSASVSAKLNKSWNGAKVRCVITDKGGHKVTSQAASVKIG